MGYIYLASPYSHPDPFVREERYLRAMRACIYFLRTEQHVYSPIVHCHELAKIGALPTDSDFWLSYNFTMLASAVKLVILRIEGYDISLGISREKAKAEALKIPVEYL